ncbi:TonB-dependent siderophore receptor [Fortiea contorta]|uniref:TonB-dependent siderophore receptor n=1 Tax=Fortiea contorta TaxID=1892405 RepID=UPI0003477D38|nr:TonB-dependent siderophore receptor [Fortiea contorta]
MKGWRSLPGVHLCVIVSFITQPAWAENKSGNEPENRINSNTTQNISRLTQIQQLLAQSTPALIQVTGVSLNKTNTGVEVTLETKQGDKLQPATRTEGNTLITDIPNSQLVLKNAKEFSADKPAAGIASIKVTQVERNTIRVTVSGEAGVPKLELFDSDEGLIFELVPAATSQLPPTQPTAENPVVETPPEAAATNDEPIELVVTGEQDGYRVRDSSTATKTDTPLRDIPQAIQVVPKQVLEAQNVTRLEEAVRNVPGVNQASAPYFVNGTFLVIRGFTARDDSGNVLRNGLPDPVGTRQIDFANIDQVEVLKGPASVLFGRANPGGTVNLITKQPLRDPFSKVEATIGSYDFYRGAIDLSGPLNDSKTVLYRLNVAYQNIGSFIDFVESNKLFIAPVISFDIGDRTKLTIEGEFSSANNEPALGVPAVGSVVSNPNGRIPLSLNVAEPTDRPFDVQTYRIGYKLQHQFSDSLSLRNEFRFSSYYATIDETFGTSLQANNRTLNRQYTERTFLQQGYNFTTDLIGKFSTGSIEHQLVFGVDLSRFDSPNFLGIGRAIAPLDIFNPVYGQPLGAPFTRFSSGFKTDALGVYVQDQIALTDNLKVLLGVRFDTFKRTDNNFVTNTQTQVSGSAFSPRVGIVYQPIQPVSLYANYSSSFTPVAGIAFDGSTFQAESGTQYEVGVKADLTNKLSAALAFYDLTRSNVLTTDPVRPGFSIQTGEQNSRGLELSLGGEILPGWNIFAGYAYTDAKITKDNTFAVGNRLNNAPENSFNLWTSYEIQSGGLRGLGFGLGFFYKGETQGDLANSFTVPSYVRTDASIFYKQDRFRTAINIRNLFDLNYYEFATGRTSVYAAEPLTVQGTISFEF